MKVKELIKKLQEIDLSGELDVRYYDFVDTFPVTTVAVETEEALESSYIYILLS